MKRFKIWISFQNPPTGLLLARYTEDSFFYICSNTHGVVLLSHPKETAGKFEESIVYALIPCMSRLNAAKGGKLTILQSFENQTPHHEANGNPRCSE